MKQLGSGILAGLLVFALVVVLGAAQESRTAQNDVVFGTLACSALATGEFNTSLAFEGTIGIFGDPSGMSLELTSVTEADPATSCQSLVDDIAGLAMSLGCAVGPVREIGFTRDFKLVCPGTRDQVITTVGDLGVLLTETIP